MANTDRLSMLERWADGMEKLEQYYEGIYGPPATPAQLPPITTRDAMLEAIADGMERAKRNINKKSPTYHDDSVAYTKTVPSGNVHYASLEKIGGRTLVFNQLVDPSKLSNRGTIASVGLTVNTNGSGGITVDGTSSQTNNVYVSSTMATLIGGHKYIMTTDHYSADWYIKIGGGMSTSNGATLYTAGSTSNVTVYLYFNSGVTFTNEVIYPHFTDLTLMYGSGNEPSTVAEFLATFPNYADPSVTFDSGSLLSAGVTEVVSKKADTTNLSTYPIPAEIQALEGYGWSAGSVYNYVDFERKVFVKNVGAVDLGTLTWGYGPSVGWSATLPNVKNPADDDTAFNGLSATLKVTDRNTQATAFSGGTDAGMVSVAGGKVYVGTGDIGIVPSGTLYYELDEPVETDISAYLADDGLIEVEVGGTLAFPNALGNNYRIDVPSSVTFVVGEP